MSETISRLLSGVKLLAGLTPEARSRLARIAHSKRYDVGRPLFHQGDPGEGMLIVLDGLVRIHLADAKGREVTLALAGPGEPIGEIALIDGGPRSADATAMTPVSALLIPHDEAVKLIDSDLATAAALLRTMAARLRRLTDQVEAVSLQPLPQRLAGALLRLSAADPSGLVRLTQGQIAALVAASRPKVNAALTEFRNRGQIESVRAGLRLLDKVSLTQLANDG
jgi:CRP/FNR family cyclic AMP-dependent transcriptional regulator